MLIGGRRWQIEIILYMTQYKLWQTAMICIKEYTQWSETSNIKHYQIIYTIAIKEIITKYKNTMLWKTFKRHTNLEINFWIIFFNRVQQA